MFCMNCGQVLPDGAKFCLNCGTPQGSLSSTISETINLDGTHTFVPAKCPNCGAQLKVDSSFKIAHCDSCDSDCLVQDAIKALTVRGNVQVSNATINVSGANTDSLLKRVEIMISDGDFSDAMSKCNTILDSDPTNGKVYFLMLLSNLRCRNRDELADYPVPFDRNKFYLKAIQYGDDSLKSELVGYINAIKASNEARRKKEKEEYEYRVKIEKEENEAKQKREAAAKALKRKQEAEYEANRKNPKVGDKFYFGTNNGQKMLWQVLEVQNRLAFIISTDIVCQTSYHKSGNPINWSDCTLRKWLNDSFIKRCFSQAEQDSIIPSNLKNNKNPQFGTHGGSSTIDKVFLLSINEANSLFVSDSARAIGSWWWLRSSGGQKTYAAIVCDNGCVNNKGNDIISSGGVRPALWIKLD